MAQYVFNGHGKSAVWPFLIFLSAALEACSPKVTPEAPPEAPKELCGELNSTIDRNIVAIAVSERQGMAADKSAVQQGARLAENNNRLSTIMINLQLQAQHKCPPRRKPIDASIYTTQAAVCYLAMLEQQIASLGSDEGRLKAAREQIASACDLNAWNAPTAK